MAALADGSLRARLQLGEDLQGACVIGKYHSGRRSIKSRAEMFVGVWHAILFQQQLRQVRRSLQFKQGRRLAFRPVDRQEQTFFGFEIIVVPIETPG